MPTVTFENQTMTCAEGERLRDVLLEAGLSPHNGQSRLLNCKGFATCGTCAVQVEGPVSRMGLRERARLSVPPHAVKAGLRLACQTQVLGDLVVTKYEGFWGQKVGQPRSIDAEEPSPESAP